jgi:hypothetical protein
MTSDFFTEKLRQTRQVKFWIATATKSFGFAEKLAESE